MEHSAACQNPFNQPTGKGHPVSRAAVDRVANKITDRQPLGKVPCQSRCVGPFLGEERRFVELDESIDLRDVVQSHRQLTNPIADQFQRAFIDDFRTEFVLSIRQ